MFKHFQAGTKYLDALTLNFPLTILVLRLYYAFTLIQIILIARSVVPCCKF